MNWGWGAGVPQGFPGGSVIKKLPANTGDARDTGSIPASGRSPGGWNGNLLQGSCLENSMDRGVWQATVLRVARSWAQLRDWACTGVPQGQVGGQGPLGRPGLYHKAVPSSATPSYEDPSTRCASRMWGHQAAANTDQYLLLTFCFLVSLSWSYKLTRFIVFQFIVGDGFVKFTHV